MPASPSQAVPSRPVLGRAALARWILLFVLALAVGGSSLRYAWPGQPFAAPLPSLGTHREWLILHVVAGSVALLLGPAQFLPGFRAARPGVHRWTGRVYAAAILVSGVAAIPVATNAAEGAVSAAGFMVLAAAWLLSTGMGVVRAVQRRFAEHRRWMIRSYALTAAAITLRLLLGANGVVGIPFHLAYPMIAWLCWVPNLILAELWLIRDARRGRRVARPAIVRPA